MKKKKTCSFYVSEYHLATMLMPYISGRLEEKIGIITFLEKGIEENIKKIIGSINLSEEKNREINNIDWKMNKIYNYSEFKDKIHKMKKINIVVAGSQSHIDIINQNINKYLSEENNTKEVIINNFYDVAYKNIDIKKVLDSHDKVLNTAGEREIEEIFEGYNDDKHEIINS